MLGLRPGLFEPPGPQVLGPVNFERPPPRNRMGSHGPDEFHPSAPMGTPAPEDPLIPLQQIAIPGAQGVFRGILIVLAGFVLRPLPGPPTASGFGRENPVTILPGGSLWGPAGSLHISTY